MHSPCFKKRERVWDWNEVGNVRMTEEERSLQLNFCIQNNLFSHMQMNLETNC